MMNSRTVLGILMVCLFECLAFVHPGYAGDEGKAPFPQEIVNSLGMKLKLIPSGTFLMGAVGDEASPSEAPIHKVTITNPFYFGTCEVTQAQWEKLMPTTVLQLREIAIKEGADNQYLDKSEFDLRNVGPDYPMYYITWEEANAFCAALSMVEDREYRLPTEAEWEYACRAGTTTKYAFGDSPEALSTFDIVATQAQGIVGTLKPNPWGLFDMHGNVHEWCRDTWSMYASSPVSDPCVDAPPALRTTRGGSWFNKASDARCSARGGIYPTIRHDTQGFRVVASAKPKR